MRLSTKIELQKLIDKIDEQDCEDCNGTLIISIMSRIRLELDKMIPLEKNDYMFIYGMYEALGLIPMNDGFRAMYHDLGQQIDTKYCKFINNEV